MTRGADAHRLAIFTKGSIFVDLEFVIVVARDKGNKTDCCYVWNPT